MITAGVGVAAGIDGMSNMEKAKKIGKNSESKYKKICSSVQKDHKSTQNLAEQYGKLKLQVQTQTIKRCITLIKQIGQKVTNNNRISWESFEGFSLEEIQEYKTAVLEAEKLITGGLKSAGMGAAAGQSAVALVGLFGTASTGAAIGGLSGAAAWRRIIDCRRRRYGFRGLDIRGYRSWTGLNGWWFCSWRRGRKSFNKCL